MELSIPSEMWCHEALINKPRLSREPGTPKEKDIEKEEQVQGR